MKKSEKKLTLNRSTVRNLQGRSLELAVGGVLIAPDNYTFEGDCPATNTCKFCSNNGH